MKKYAFTFLPSLLVLLFPFSQTNLYAVPSHKNSEVIISMKSSPAADFQTTVRIQSSKLISGIIKSRSGDGGVVEPVSDAYLTLRHNGEVANFLLNTDGTLFDRQQRKTLYPSPSVQNKLQEVVRLLRIKHYGKMTAWPEVSKLLPNKARCQIIDLETGLTFNVQKRAGHKHADMQPLTREDTKIMKEIYRGKWSWDRRAILVKTDNELIAASMNGMPHGGGALRNGFPGHFCVHFFGSTTHRSKNTDPIHQLMIYKAAGRLDDYFEQLTPYELVDIFLATFNQRDPYLVKKALSEHGQNHPGPRSPLFDALDGIVSIGRHSPFEQKSDRHLLAVDIPVNVRIYTKARGEEKTTLHFLLTRNILKQRWEIDDIQLDSDTT